MDWSKLKILVVEDDDATRRMVVHYLSGCGATTVEAATGPDALNLITPDLDIGLVDIGLPTISGLQLIPYFVRLNIPIIIYSGYVSETVRKEAIKLGATDFIEKPFRLTVLEQAVKRILNPPQSGPSQP